MNLVQAQQFAKSKINEHLDSSWSFKFDSASRRFGCCNYKTKTISISRALTSLNDEATVRNTILHEVAHALAGREHGHNSTWKSLAWVLGCDGNRTYSNSVIRPKVQWKATCPTCFNFLFYTRKNSGLACGRCCNLFNNGSYSPKFILKWEKA